LDLEIGNGIPSLLQFSFIAIYLPLKRLNTSILALPLNGSTKNGEPSTLHGQKILQWIPPHLLTLIGGTFTTDGGWKR
jgi:hypothetical protein